MSSKYKNKRQDIKNKADQKHAEDVKEFGAQPVLKFHVKPEIEKNINNKIDLSNEIELLKEGQVPSQVIYNGEGINKLTNMDNNLVNFYTITINIGIENIIRNYGPEFRYYKKLWQCLGQTNDWIDIGTGNGIVSNNIAFNIRMLLSLAKSEYSTELIKKSVNEYMDYAKNIESKSTVFTSCDLSQSSLNHASKISKNNFFQLHNLFDLDYYQGDLEDLIKSKGNDTPKLITMFNMLANFEYEDLKNMLKKVYDSMGNNDVFITTFFNKKGDQKFLDTTKSLYDNSETEDWIVSSFSDRYGVDKNKIKYYVDFNNDGRFFVDAGVVLDKNTKINIPKDEGEFDTILAKEILQNKGEDSIKLNMLKSYRMSEEDIINLCKSIGFKVDGIMYSDDELQIMPILYK